MADPKMGLQATWAMAVGGMVGGGIFSVLGLVIAIAGPWAWLAFVLAGAIALATGWSYVSLAARFGEGGGAFTFLREVHREGLAGSLSWVLVLGYVLTMAVYAFTFGHYVGHVLGLGPLAVRGLGVAVVVALVAVNLRGVGSSAGVEIVTVWGKMLVLLGLAAFGLARFDAGRLAEGLEGPFAPSSALVAAASVFMAYEGFQLLTYDYDDIRDPRRTLQLGVLLAIAAVIATYVLVALGAASLVGAGTLVAQKEIALASAGEAVLGRPGTWIVTVAAGFSTASAINATLFATARLAEQVARDGEMPAAAAHENRAGVPDRAVLALGGLAALLSAVGSLGVLVEAASVTFLFTFALVNGIAARRLAGVHRVVAGAGALGATAAAGVLIVRLAGSEPEALVGLAALVLVATAGRALLLRRRR